jgi:hypothetical protein
MGKFAKKVRRNKIQGPNQRGFNRADWEAQLSSISLDQDDKRLLHAGLFFDDLLCFIRKDKGLSQIALSTEAIIRLIIAIATHNLFRIHEEIKIRPTNGNLPPTLNISEIMEETLQLSTGQQFSPDELISGLGDGMKHILRELLPAKTTFGGFDEYEADEHVLDQVNQEFNKAIIYQCAVESWNDCVGNGYGIAKHDQGLALVPSDRELEIARIVSIYRRHSIDLDVTLSFIDIWSYSLPRKDKEKMCGIQLVKSIVGQDRIEHILLGLNNKLLFAASSTIASKLRLQHNYYRSLLDDPLPNFSDFTLNQIILGWQLLQSLSGVIFDSFKPSEKVDVRGLLNFTPRIAKRTLCGTFSKALSLDHQQANLLINVFVFDPNHSLEVWCQPLISLQDDYCLVIPCIHSIQLQRVVEGWMRQGGLSLERRGPEFEMFCREELALSLKSSLIRRFVFLVDQSFTFKPPKEQEEEIDIIIIVADTILLIEAKCILWPDESLQFANYHDTVKEGVKQIVRKRDAVLRNYESFSGRLKQLGYRPPAKCSLVCCVLTNSAVYSGFPINGVPIVDLSILGSFFRNEHVKFETRHKGKTIVRRANSFYKDAIDAGEVLGRYLTDPPQLSDLRKSVKKREVVFPVENNKFGKLVQELYSVEIDVNEIQRLYGEHK